MKKYLLLLFLMTISSQAFGKISFAILPIEVKKGITAADDLTAYTRISSDLLKSKKYKLVDRKTITKVLKEQKFQLSGAAEMKKLVKVGKLLGVNKMISSSLSWRAKSVCMHINVIDVETGEIEITHEECDPDPARSASYCARKVINKYQMVGHVIGISGNKVVINLGKNDGISGGQEIFIARKESLKDVSDSVLFEDTKRLGKLKVIKVTGGRAVTKSLFFKNKNLKPQKNDLVSPEPIPYAGPKLSNKPLLPNAEKSDEILDDDMEDKKYLSPLGNEGNSYVDGKLLLNNSQSKEYHVYAYYPSPFDDLDDFILEVDIEFLKISGLYNKISISVRDDRSYYSGYAYSFMINDEGGFQISLFKFGDIIPIVPLQTSPHIKRKESENTLKIVAVDSKFDFYINDEFVIGFKEETIRRGGIGIYLERGSKATLDNLKIWKIKK
jgi:hypothetical protein